MQQILIHELLDLINRMGGERITSQLIMETNEDDDPMIWSENEVDRAITFLHGINNAFRKAAAMDTVKALQKKYNLEAEHVLEYFAEMEKSTPHDEL